MLQSIGSQRVGHNWVTDLNWTELNLCSLFLVILLFCYWVFFFPPALSHSVWPYLLFLIDLLSFLLFINFFIPKISFLKHFIGLQLYFHFKDINLFSETEEYFCFIVSVSHWCYLMTLIFVFKVSSIPNVFFTFFVLPSQLLGGVLLSVLIGFSFWLLCFLREDIAISCLAARGTGKYCCQLS